MLALEAKTGVKSPRLLSRPQLRADCKRYWEGFWTVANSRQFNQVGLQPLPISEVSAYIDIAGIQKGYPAQKFLRLAQAMDAAHLESWAKKNNKKS